MISTPDFAGVTARDGIPGGLLRPLVVGELRLADRVHVGLRPVRDLGDCERRASRRADVIEYSTVTGTVAKARRQQEPVALELLQRLRQHLLRDALDVAPQLG